MKTLSRLPFLLLTVLCVACSSHRGSSARTDPQLITRAQIDENNFTNAYDAVAALHGIWLRERGPDSFNTPGKVLVYYDNVRLGGVETLRGVASTEIAYIRFFDGNAATQRWGVGHSNGVILVSTHPD